MTPGFGTGTMASVCMAFMVGVTPTAATAQVSCATPERASAASTVRWQPPLDRRVCVSYRSIPAGAALMELLEGVSVQPVVTDSDRVVLAPSQRQSSASADVNRLRASASYDFRRTLSFVISAENLLDHQLGEPDNVTVLPGRTITGGVRAKF
jgi:hypothetical protein